MADRIEMEGNERLPVSEGGARPPWGRRILTLLIAVAAIGGFAMVVVYSYEQSGDPATEKTAPVITAQAGPTKVRPDSPGGMSVPNQDKQIYGQIDSARMPEKVERLLPPPEPVLIPPPSAPATAMPPPPAAEPDRAAREMATVEPAAGKADKPERAAPPRKTAEPAMKLAAKPPSSPPAAGRPTATASAPPPAMPEKAATAKAPPAAVASLGASWRIQIASLRTEEAAKTAWSRLSKKNGDLLGKLQHRIVRIDLAGKGTFYRLQAGPVGDASEAKALCSRVKQRKIGCLVVRP
jgi:hypothetical protein